MRRNIFVKIVGFRVEGRLGKVSDMSRDGAGMECTSEFTIEVRRIHVHHKLAALEPNKPSSYSEGDILRQATLSDVSI